MQSQAQPLYVYVAFRMGEYDVRTATVRRVGMFVTPAKTRRWRGDMMIFGGGADSCVGWIGHAGSSRVSAGEIVRWGFFGCFFWC